MTGLAAGGPARPVPTRINTGLASDRKKKKTFAKHLTLQKILSYYKNKLIKKPL